MRVRLAAALTVLTLLTLPAAARIFWPSSDGDYLEGYRLYRNTCHNALQTPASCADTNGIFAGFMVLQNAKVPDETTAIKIATDYIAAHPWPAVANGFSLQFRLEDHDGITWHGTIHALNNKASHGQAVPPETGKPVGHIWVKPDGTAFYPVGYK